MAHYTKVFNKTFLLCRNIKSCIKNSAISLSSKSQSDQPKEIKRDMVGSPNPVSNLRPTRFHIPQNESSLESAYRLRRHEVQKWNEAFWSKHNSNFFKQRDKFIATNTPMSSSESEENKLLTSDEMSVFYKRFLDQNWKSHLYYNMNWYYKNIGLLVLAVRVALHRTTRRLLRTT